MIAGLSERLKELRNKYAFSQKQVAQRLGVSPSIVSGYETGERTPSTEVLLGLSRMYHVSTDYLLGRSMPAQRYILDLEGLTDSQKAALIALVQSMKEPSDD